MKLKFQNIQHIIPVILGFALLSPILVFAITKGEIITPQEYGITPVPVQNVPQAVGVVRGVVQTTYIVFFIIATLFILFAAYNYLTASGQPEKISAAHKQLLYAGIAIAVALLAVGTSAIIRNFLENPAAGGGVGGGGTATPTAGYQPLITPVKDFPGRQVSPEITYPKESQSQAQPIKGTEGPDIR